MRVRPFIKPWVFVVVPVIASVLVWMLPGRGLLTRGFVDRSDLSFGAVITLTVWYTVAAAIASIGALIGRMIPMSERWLREQQSNSFERRFYAILSICSIVGVAGAYVTIGREYSISAALSGSSVNDLSAVLLGGSSIATLRYAAIVAAPLGVILVLERKVRLPLVVLNVALLLAAALLSSRLSLIMATAVFVIVYFLRNPAKRVRVGAVVLASALLFAALTFFNFYRNANYYRAIGIDNPIAMNVSQVETYVGAPAQVSIGVANALFNGQLPRSVPLLEALQSITPTFLSGPSESTALTGSAVYDYKVDVASNLTTNSTFADVYAYSGWWGLVLTLLVLGCASFLFGYFSRTRSILCSVAAVIAYCYLEFWRIFLLNQGIIIFLLLILAVSAGIARVTAKRTPFAEVSVE